MYVWMLFFSDVHVTRKIHVLTFSKGRSVGWNGQLNHFPSFRSPRPLFKAFVFPSVCMGTTSGSFPMTHMLTHPPG